MVNIVIEGSIASPHAPVADPKPISILHKKTSKVVAIVEVKKNMNDDIELVDAKAVIECIVYVQYMMCIEQLSKLVGTVTDGTSWHCWVIPYQINMKITSSDFYIISYTGRVY